MSTIKSSSEHLTLNADGASKDIKFQANGVEKASISSAGAFTATTIDATKLTGALPVIDGASLTGTGKVLQVVQTVKTDIFSSTTGGSWFDITGLSATITPSSTSSKIMVMMNIQVGMENNQYSFIRIRRDSTTIGIGDSAGSRTSATSAAGGFSATIYDNYKVRTVILEYLDSPSTTSATTYKPQANSYNTDGFYVNRSKTDLDAIYGSRLISTITLMEIGV